MGRGFESLSGCQIEKIKQMCEQCLADTVGWENVLPGWHLIQARKDGELMKIGEYGLVKMDNPVIIFSEKPIKDPYGCMSDEEIDSLPEEKSKELYKKLWEFHRLADRNAARGFIEPSRCLEKYAEIISAAKETGFDEEENGIFWYWLHDHIARYLENHPEPDYD